jgi:hypothetical protein
MGFYVLCSEGAVVVCSWSFTHRPAISIKKADLYEGSLTSDTLWCKKNSEKLSSYSSPVVKGSNVRLREEREKHMCKVGCLSVCLYFLDLFLKMKYLENRV